MPREIACSACGVAIPATYRSGFCRECRRRHCKVCKCRLPEGRRSTYCTDCAREEREQSYQAPGRQCSSCLIRLPVGHRGAYCAPCLSRRNREDKKRRNARTDRLCVACQVPLGGPVTRARCLDCDRERRVRVSLQPGKRCAFCKTARPALGEAYCRACNAMACAQRRARLRGDPVAAELGRPKS